MPNNIRTPHSNENYHTYHIKRNKPDISDISISVHAPHIKRNKPDISNIHIVYLP